MKKTKNIIIIAATAISSSLATLVVLGFCVLFYVIQPFQKEAVDRGFANWEVTNNATGSTAFRWNEFAQAMHPDNPNNFFAEIEKPLN